VGGVPSLIEVDVVDGAEDVCGEELVVVGGIVDAELAVDEGELELASCGTVSPLSPSPTVISQRLTSSTALDPSG
jgi:hypothetical protein